MLQPIIDIFSSFFNFLHGIVVSLGIDANSGLSFVLAVFLLTVIIKLILLPLGIKSQKSTIGMQKIQPEVAKIQAKYKNNPEKMNMEMMKLYKENNVSMTGGCLPLLIQMPILMALYWAFNQISGIDGASFLWIPDLNAPNFILAVISGVTTFLSMNITSKIGQPKKEEEEDKKAKNSKSSKNSKSKKKEEPATPGMPNMKTMNIFMSIFMGYSATLIKSLLVIYWIMSNVLGIAQTYLVKSIVNKSEAKKDAA